jgi:hypothetical protein
MCHQFAELNFFNNVADFAVTIPDHVGRDGYGPGVGLSQPKGEPAEDQ